MILNTSSAINQASNGKFLYDLWPDCSVYKKGTILKDHKRLDFSHVNLVMEFKKDTSFNPFSKEVPGSEMTKNTFVRHTSKTLGQLTAYASSVLGSQYCMHAFMVFIAGDIVRLIQWDHSGVIILDQIEFNKEPHLFDFFIHYNNVDDGVLGCDTTVTVFDFQRLV